MSEQKNTQNEKSTWIVAHFGDVHIAAEQGEVPQLQRLIGKRILGTINLRFLGRGNAFENSRRRFRLLLRDVVAHTPDFIVSSGDFSAMSFPAEFQVARDILLDELGDFSSRLALIPGNHDRYTLGETIRDNFSLYFGSWMQSDLALPDQGQHFPFVRIVADRLAFVFIDVVRFHPLSTGKVTPEIMHNVEYLLQRPELRTKQIIFVLHYPPYRADGAPLAFTHRCLHIEQLLEIAQHYGVKALLTGHVHDNYLYQIPDTKLYLINSGSGTKRRRSTYNLYYFTPPEVRVVRRLFDNEHNRFSTMSEQTISW